MNLLGKIFVVLIFVMSLVFAAFSIMVYATHTNWRQEIMRTPAEVRGNQQPGYKHQLEQARADNADLTDQIARLTAQKNAELAAKNQALAKEETMNQALSKEKAALDEQLKAKDMALAQKSEALRVSEENEAHMTAENKGLREQIAAAHRETDEHVKKSVALQDRLTIATGQLSVLKERNDQLSKDVTNARLLLGSKGATLQDPVDASKIHVAGTVTAVSSTKVELSIGFDDGVRVGQQLDIYRGDKYVGRIKIIDAKPDNAVGSILTEYQQLPIQRGDNVASHIST
jgi:multidrug efflux pump subunit AcrA (membrane-fusion protein)